MSSSRPERVVILGASAKPERYSHQALQSLREHGHEVIPVHPAFSQIDGIPVVADVSQVEGAVDTVTMYVGADISGKLTDKLIALKPKRVIFNPGAENPELARKLQGAGIQTEEACTLVLLATGRYN